MVVRLAIASMIAAAMCIALLDSAYAASRAPQDTIAERVSACTTCHGPEGRATSAGYFPRIAGKPRGYLFNQLVNFRDGRRHYALMTYLVEHLTDTYLDEIAGYFAGLDLPYPSPQPAGVPGEALARGEALVRNGVPARKIPACVECHGATLTGVSPNVPGLLGLPRDYLQAQLGRWRTGERRAHAPDCMAKIAAELTPQETADIVAWLSSRSVPLDSKPAATLARSPAMPCGGVGR